MNSDFLLTGYPDEIDHYGIKFRKHVGSDGLGNYVLKYRCITFPNIDGPDLAVTTVFPSERQIRQFLFGFHDAVGKYLAAYVSAIESQRDQKKPMFFDRS